MSRIDALLSEARRRAERVAHKAHPKQLEFLALSELEALYGGAAGGGKSDALLMAAEEHVDRPRYAALLLRRTYPDLKLPGAIMDRSQLFFGDRARWNEVDRRWTFPSGAVIQFGYCDNEQDLGRYKSSEFQFIGVDELTEWPERWYTFLFSRLRRTEAHGDIPLRMRAATNPDGLGQEWVRRRFGIPLNETPTALIRTVDGDDARVFLPARAEDNPSLDLAAYERSLRKMGPARYAQLRWGRWLRDGEGLVYKFDVERNRAPKLRAVLEGRGRWSFILSHDYGTTNATAWAVLGWQPHDPVLYVVESFKHAGMSPSQAGELSKSLIKKYAPERVVGDLGGLGKGYAEEGRKRFHLPIEAAPKENKRGYIDLLNGDLLGGRVQLLDGNEELEKEWTELPWAKHRIEGEQQKEAPGFANHIADAVLYGWRVAYAYLEEPRAQAEQDEPTRQREEEERLVQQLKDDEKTEWWDR